MPASASSRLANRKSVGRTSAPVLTSLGAEGLLIGEYDHITNVIGAAIVSSYAATECLLFSYGLGERWLHVNSGWAVLTNLLPRCLSNYAERSCEDNGPFSGLQ
jgi:phenylacetate-CoA ligase